MFGVLCRKQNAIATYLVKVSKQINKLQVHSYNGKLKKKLKNNSMTNYLDEYTILYGLEFQKKWKVLKAYSPSTDLLGQVEVTERRKQN